jgi:hypothetical protein
MINAKQAYNTASYIERYSSTATSFDSAFEDEIKKQSNNEGIVEILKKGDPSRGVMVAFTCAHKCGTTWIADKRAYQKAIKNDGSIHTVVYSCKCPVCGEMVYTAYGWSL